MINRFPVLGEFQLANCLSFELGSNSSLDDFLQQVRKELEFESITEIKLNYFRIFQNSPIQDQSFEDFRSQHNVPHVVDYCFEKHFSNFNLTKEMLVKEILDELYHSYEISNDWNLFCETVDMIVGDLNFFAMDHSLGYDNFDGFNLDILYSIIREKVKSYITVHFSKFAEDKLAKSFSNLYQMYSGFPTFCFILSVQNH